MKKASASTKPAADVGRVPIVQPGSGPGVPVDDPTEMPYPGYAREAAALAAKVAAAKRSQAAPLPGPLREAFAGEPRRVCGLTLQPVNAWLLAILTRINSPLLEVLRIYREHASEIAIAPAEEQAKLEAAILQEAAAGKLAPEAVIETIFAFVTPVEECQQLLDAGAFREAALQSIGKKFHPAQLSQLQRDVGAYYCASFATALSISPVVTAGGEGGEVFSQPPPMIRTASAGGSPSSAR